MSCYVINYQDGHKVARPVETEAEYRALRGSERQCRMVDACRNGSTEAKRRLLQMNYSCIPTDGILRGCKTQSNSVGMNIDFDPSDPAYEQKMAEVPQMILAKKDEVGLLMLERSVKKGYHMVFKRRPELSQEENLRWASELLGVKYDEGAKDITRVFFTTTADADDLLFLSQELFEQKNADDADEADFRRLNNNKADSIDNKNENAADINKNLRKSPQSASSAFLRSAPGEQARNPAASTYDNIPYIAPSSKRLRISLAVCLLTAAGTSLSSRWRVS